MAAFSKPTSGAVIWPLNDRALDPITTIQNETGALITVTVTAQPIQTGSPVYGVPAQGALTIADGASEILSNRYTAMTLAGTGTGFLYILQGQ
tara:strand:- start:4495 stop:4773 length:279 start_codon:yes stop_codon:yes gene_type:complete